MTIDPITGLPVDDNGNTLDATAAGSNIVSESDPEALPLQGPPQASTPFAHPAASIPMPGEAAPKRQSVSTSYEGISQPQLKTVTKLQSTGSKAADADIARFAPQYEQQAAMADNVAAEHKAALQQEVDATREHATRETELFKAQADFIKEQQDLERHAYAQSQIVRQQYMANYEHELLNAKMLAMSSGDPNERMGPGAAAGLIAAEAVQGFLKVGGINIDVTGQVDRFINREIGKHQQMVADANNAAEGQLHLYNLARQNASDDYEARERYRGFVLEGLKTQIGAEASRFGSQLAMATAAQKAAEVDAQLLQVKQNLADRQQALYFQAQQMRINQAHMMAQDSIAKQHLAIAQAKEEREKTAKAASGSLSIPDPGATVRDKTGKIVGVQNIWRINPNATDAQKNDATKLAAEEGGKYAAIKQHLDELRKLRAPAFDDFAEQYGYEGAKARFSEAYREYQRQKIMIQEATIQAFTGAAAPNEQMNRLKSLLADDSGFQKGGNASGIDQLEKYFRDNYITKINQHPGIETIPETERTTREYGNVGNDTDSNYGARLFGRDAAVGPVADALKDVSKVGRHEVKQTEYGGGFSALHNEYVKETGDRSGLGTTDNREKAVGQRTEIDGVDHLAALVAKPELAHTDTVNGQAVGNPEDTRAKAFMALKSLAEAGTVNDTKVDPVVQRYAAYVLKKMESTPETEVENFFTSVSQRVYPAGEEGGTDPSTPLGEWMARDSNKAPLPPSRAEQLNTAFPRELGKLPGE